MHRRASSLAVISSAQRDALRTSAGLPPLAEDSPSFSSIWPTFLRRKMRLAATLLAIGGFVFFVLVRSFSSPPSSSSSRQLPLDADTAGDRAYPPQSRVYNGAPPAPLAAAQKDSRVAAAAAVAKAGGASTVSTPGITLTPAEELAAVIAYLTSLGANALIPTSIDPSVPIDPEIVLEFNTRSSRAKSELAHLVAETWSLNPVVMFTESRSPISKAVKVTLDSFSLLPEPVIFDVDQRDDDGVLTPLIYRLTGSTSLPIVLVGGQSLGTSEDIVALYKSGILRKKLDASGAIVNGNKKKHRGR